MPAEVEEFLGYRGPQLDQFMMRRLSGEPVGPPIPSRSDEGPEDALVHAYLEAGADFKQAINESIRRLMARLEEDSEYSGTQWSARLFALIGAARISEAGPQMASLLLMDTIRGDKSWRKVQGVYRKSLLLELMVALRAIGPAKQPLNWSEFLTEPHLAGSAFGGLTDASLDQALMHLPILANEALKHPNDIPLRQCLIYWLARWCTERPGIDAISKIQAVMSGPGEPSGARNLVTQTLALIPLRQSVVKATGTTSKAALTPATVHPPTPSNVEQLVQKQGQMTQQIGDDKQALQFQLFAENVSTCLRPHNSLKSA